MFQVCSCNMDQSFMDRARKVCSCNMDHSFMERARKVFVQYGPFIYEKGAKCVLKLYVCKQRQEREQRSLLKLIELKRNSRSGKSVLRASFASKWCEQVCLEAYLLGGSLHT